MHIKHQISKQTVKNSISLSSTSTVWKSAGSFQFMFISFIVLVKCQIVGSDLSKFNFLKLHLLSISVLSWNRVKLLFPCDSRVDKFILCKFASCHGFFLHKFTTSHVLIHCKIAIKHNLILHWHVITNDCYQN